MRHVILGTAGHIDHGKSTLVHAMTGIDPDRLKEEKERGITIDLGFADLEFPDYGLSVGIVDVPGHERLIKNMLAGAGGIDIVLMVIAADEGIMPQSREHLHICNLLKIKAGIIALTKADLVEEEWLALVEDEIKDFVRGTFLESAPVVPVSSKSGFNIDKLKNVIRDLSLNTTPKPTKGLFRLPVDRVFTLKGFGTVVTGTAISGAVNLDEQVEILPSGIKTKVRGLHSHGKSQKTVSAGQRAAINLQSAEKEELKRGDMVVAPGRFTPTDALDARLELLADAPVLKSRSQVHFHIGTSETVARVILYETDALSAGQSAYCQLRITEPVIAQAGDRFVIRRFSPLETMGGGVILDPSPIKRKKRDGIEDLQAFESATLEEKIGMKIKKCRLKGITRAALEGWIKAEVQEVRDAIGKLKGQGAILKIEDVLIHKDTFDVFSESLVAMISEFHRDNPLKPGMPKEEARVKLMADYRTFGDLVELTGNVITERDILKLKSFSASVTDEDKNRILDMIEKDAFSPPLSEELSKALNLEQKQMNDTLKIMSKEGSIVRINESIYMGPRAYASMMEKLKAHYEAKDTMTVAEFRDLLGTSRKYALPLLEYMDSNRITLRVDDVRKLLLKS